MDFKPGAAECGGAGASSENAWNLSMNHERFEAVLSIEEDGW